MEKRNHNIQYLRGNRHIDDKRYQELMAEDMIIIPDEDLYTPRVNLEFIKEDPGFRSAYVRKKLSENGLLEEEVYE